MFLALYGITAELYEVNYQEIKGLREILKESKDDLDMCKMVNEELESAVEKEKDIQQELLLKMLPKDEADSRNCILEVRAGDITGFIVKMVYFIIRVNISIHSNRRTDKESWAYLLIIRLFPHGKFYLQCPVGSHTIMVS